MNKEIELKFLEKTLERYGLKLKNVLVSEIDKKELVSKSGNAHLKDKIRYEINRTGLTGYSFKLYFPDYGRFIEINYHKSKSIAKSTGLFSKAKGSSGLFSKAVQTNANPLRKKRKDTRWYSKSAYGSLNPLIGEIMYGMTDQVQEMLRNELSQTKG